MSPAPISLEPPLAERDPSTGRPLVLYDYAEGGKPVWKGVETTEELLGKTVRRIWEDKGGLVNFSQLQLESAILQEERNDQPMLEDAPYGNEDHDTEQQSPLVVGLDLDPEQMKAFKLAITDRLREASHSLGTFNLILSLLLPSTHTPAASLVIPPEVPVPPSSFSATQILHRPAPSVEPLDDLAIKQDALRAMADVFKTSGEELGKVVAKAEVEWNVALGVRELGGCAVGVRGVERAFMGGDGKRDARDWVGWYGLDTAPPAFRMRHYAHLSAPESSVASSSSPPHLVFPNRTRRRLQVTLTHKLNGRSISSSSDFLARRSVSTDQESDTVARKAAKEMEDAMWEAVEEETFVEIIAEARQLMHTLPSRISHNSIKIEVSPGLELTIALVSPSSSLEASTSTSSAYPTLLLTLLVDSLLSLHAHRSTHIALASRPVRDPRVLANPVAASRPKLLQGVVEVAQFHGLEQRVRGLVEELTTGLRNDAGSVKGKERERSGVGMRVKVEWEGGDEGWRGMELGGAECGMRVREEGRKCVLTMESGPPITIHILPPLRINLIVPNRHRHQSSSAASASASTKNETVVTITDLVHLASLLELEIKDVVLRTLADIPSSETTIGEGKVEGFVDRLQGVTLLQWERGEIRLDPHLTLSTSSFAPSLIIRAAVRSMTDPEGREEVFDSSSPGKGKGKRGIWSWATQVWCGRDEGSVRL